MFVTIWMCTQEWSLISSRATAFTFATCHQAFIWSSRLTRPITRRSGSLRRTGHVDPHPGDRLDGREPNLALGLGGDRVGELFGFELVLVRPWAGAYARAAASATGRGICHEYAPWGSIP